MRKISEHEKVIEAWMKATFHDGGIDRFDDLHIDKIDPLWADKDQWIKAGIEVFSSANRVRDHLQLKIEIVLAISLNPDAMVQIKNFEIIESEELSNYLSWTPPSLYLFRPNDRFWMKSSATEESSYTEISIIQLPNVFQGLQSHAFFYKKRKDSNESALTIFITS